MNKQEFNQQMKRMNESYRDYYSTERLKIIWSVVSEMPANRFSKAVDKAIWADFPPKLDWFQRLKSDFHSYQAPAVGRSYDHESMPPEKVKEIIDRIFRRRAVL